MRIDVLTDLMVVEFSKAWKNKTNNSLFGARDSFYKLADLIKNKTATNRPTNMTY